MIAKRIKIVADSPLGLNAKVLDADTGEEIGKTRDIVLHIPIDGAITATVEMVVDELEYVGELSHVKPIIMRGQVPLMRLQLRRFWMAARRLFSLGVAR